MWLKNRNKYVKFPPNTQSGNVIFHFLIFSLFIILVTIFNIRPCFPLSFLLLIWICKRMFFDEFWWKQWKSNCVNQFWFNCCFWVFILKEINVALLFKCNDFKTFAIRAENTNIFTFKILITYQLLYILILVCTLVCSFIFENYGLKFRTILCHIIMSIERV